MSRARALLEALRAGFWFVPALVVLGSMATAVLLVELDTASGAELAEWSPRLFGVSAEGSRAMLSAIATSMITVAGVVFSITVVVLSQTSTQYSPRVLRNFMRDRPTQAVLGVFVGVFAYCLVVLRTVRGSDESGGFIPSIAVLAGMAYAFCAIAMLIFFIHHVAQSIQASSIVERIAQDTRDAIDHLFPQELGAPPRAPPREWPLPASWVPVVAGGSGYVVSIDADRVLRWAVEHDRLLRLALGIGDFAVEGALLMEAAGSTPLPAREAARLQGMVRLGRERTTEQDAAFGLQQLVDVAVKAQSPGINDPTTAGMCIDRLGALLVRLAARHMPDPHRVQDGRLRLIARGPDFRQLVDLVFRPLLAHSRSDVQVLTGVLQAMEWLAGAAREPYRRAALAPLARELRFELRKVRPSTRIAQAHERLLRLEIELRPCTPGAARGGEEPNTSA